MSVCVGGGGGWVGARLTMGRGVRHAAVRDGFTLYIQTESEDAAQTLDEVING